MSQLVVRQRGFVSNQIKSNRTEVRGSTCEKMCVVICDDTQLIAFLLIEVYYADAHACIGILIYMYNTDTFHHNFI
jgi:hypothetical protein